jgi:Tfp pilus assembly protein PilX
MATSSRRQSRRRRGSVLFMVLVALGVIGTIAISLMLISRSTFNIGRRQPRLTSLIALADAGVQYGYWQYQYQNQTPSFTFSNVPLGQGSFTVTVNDNSANLAGTLQIVSKATIGSDTWSETKVISNGNTIPPAGLKNFLLAPGNTSMSLTWLPSSIATSYSIARSTTAGKEAFIKSITTTSYRDTALKNGKSYYYIVSAVNSAGTGPWSSELSSKPKNSNLVGTVAAGLSEVNLTTEGQFDWAEYGLDPFDDMKTGGGKISNYSQIGSTAAKTTTGQTMFDWTNGAPTLSVNQTTSILYMTGVGNGFSITAPADTTVRTLRIYMGVWYGRAQVTATLSDGSTKAYSNTAIKTTGKSATPISGTYTFVYSASKANKVLTVNVTLYSQTAKETGEVFFEGASLF